jgi:hypothetical protein
MIFIANFIFKDLTSITLEFFSARRNSRAIVLPGLFADENLSSSHLMA